jgi:hypothetical protein
MRPARFSILTLVFAVALIAIDIALVQELFIRSRLIMVSVRHGLLMVNVLAIAAYRIWAGRVTYRPFLSGFVAVGLATALVCQACCCILAPDAMYEYQARLAFPVALAINGFLPRFSSAQNGHLYFKIFFYAATIPAIAVVVGLPQLLVALVGGLISWSLHRWISPYVAKQRPRPPQRLPRLPVKP